MVTGHPGHPDGAHSTLRSARRAHRIPGVFQGFRLRDGKVRRAYDFPRRGGGWSRPRCVKPAARSEWSARRGHRSERRGRSSGRSGHRSRCEGRRSEGVAECSELATERREPPGHRSACLERPSARVDERWEQRAQCSDRRARRRERRPVLSARWGKEPERRGQRREQRSAERCPRATRCRASFAVWHHRAMLRAWMKVGAPVAALALLVVACGSSSSGGSEPLSCTSSQACTQTSHGQTCIQACAAGGVSTCPVDTTCTMASGCCQGTGCSAVAVHVCCPSSGC